MTAVTSKMSRMVLLYTLILCMVSLPTSLPKHFLVETADNQGGDDYSYSEAAEEALELLYRPSPFGVLGEDSKEQQNKGKLFMIPWSFIQIFRHSRQSKQFMTLF